MFCNNYRERDQNSVKIEGVSGDMMKVLIRYAYTSYLEINCNDVQTVLEAASLLQVKFLIQFQASLYINAGL